MTTESPTPDAADDPRDLTLYRELDAPRALVWATLTEPAHLSRWWGPSGFTMETHQHELRVGGVWEATMHGPDGRAYENHVIFDEVVPEERLVLRYVSEDDDPHLHVTTVTLDALGPRRTRLTLTVRFPTEKIRKAMETFAAPGGRQTLGKLAALLADLQADGGAEAGGAADSFVLRRVVKARPEKVWAAWTDADALHRWFHPTSWSIFSSELDLRVGGRFFYGFRGPDFPEAFGLWRFTEIVPLQRLCFDLCFADADGQPTPSPFGGPWPARIATEVLLEPHASFVGGTLLTLRSTPVQATDEERAAFRAMHEGMEQGWGETLDSLAAFFAP
ncbi:MAG: SRPBCC domain-containing protein [Alphaproteobacteria bacterium]|nr:SRPBCC domain-containing protein [Alphaproteobacteria bacterium]